MNISSAIVVGAGINGLALARALALRGTRVVVFERHERAAGASARDAGLVWPLAVANGAALEKARRSRAVWREFCEAAQVWYDPAGCLVPAMADDELALLQEFEAANAGQRELALLGPGPARERCAALPARGLRGALWSGEEMRVDARVALRRMPAWLAERHEIEFRFKHAVTRVEHPYVWSGGRRHAADAIFLAGGAELRQLQAPLFERGALRLEPRLVARLAPQPEGWRLPLPLCTAAQLTDYSAFAALASAARLRARSPEVAGVCLLQNASGELLAVQGSAAGEAAENPDSARQRQLLDSLRGLLQLADCRIVQSWQVEHAGAAEPGGSGVIEAEPGVFVVTAPDHAGLGMTLAFGQAEDIVAAQAGAVRRLSA
jgi:FAD dependent oxidoreductase TIGR03364